MILHPHHKLPRSCHPYRLHPVPQLLSHTHNSTSRLEERTITSPPAETTRMMVRWISPLPPSKKRQLLLRLALSYTSSQAPILALSLSAPVALRRRGLPLSLISNGQHRSPRRTVPLPGVPVAIISISSGLI